MTRPDPLQPATTQHSFRKVWTQALVSLLVSLAGLMLGWHLSEQGHSRLPSASQTTPALPELRPVASTLPGLQGVGNVPDLLAAAPLPRWTVRPLNRLRPVRRAQTDLLTLGRMNLDGG